MAQLFDSDIVTLTYKEGSSSVYCIYPIVKENGQRKYGPPSDWPKPPEGSEVFVGHLPRDLDGKSLLTLFSTVGRIYQVRVMLDFSGFNRGYAFVSFTLPSEAARAVRKFNDFEIMPGHKIGVVISKDNRRLTISNLPPNKTAQEVRDLFKTLVPGIPIKRVFVIPLGEKSKAKLEFLYHKSVANASRLLILPGEEILWRSSLLPRCGLVQPKK